MRVLAEENEDAVEAFLKNHPEFSLERMQMLGAPDVDSDTMFVAIMKRES